MINEFEHNGYLIEYGVDYDGIDDELLCQSGMLAEQGIAIKHDDHEWTFGLEDLPGKLLDSDAALDRMWLELDDMGSDMYDVFGAFRREATADNKAKLDSEINRLVLQLGTLSGVAENTSRIVAKRFGAVRVWVDLDVWQKYANSFHESALQLSGTLGTDVDPTSPVFDWHPIQWEAEQIDAIVNGALYYACVTPIVDGEPDRENYELALSLCAGVTNELISDEDILEGLRSHM